MQEREKQIEEMAKIFCGMKNGCDGCMWDKAHCNERNYAEEIYNAGYRKQSEWISVEERLPDKKEYDWVLVNVLLTSENYYGVPQIAELRNGKWWGYDDFPLSEVGCKVTHWMPLPEAPKMKGGEE